MKLALTLLLFTSCQPWEQPHTAQLTRSEAQQLARDWWGPTGAVWTAADLSDNEVGKDTPGFRVGVITSYGARRFHGRAGSWEEAFRDARRRGYNPSNGYDYKLDEK